MYSVNFASQLLLLFSLLVTRLQLYNIIINYIMYSVNLAFQLSMLFSSLVTRLQLYNI